MKTLDQVLDGISLPTVEASMKAGITAFNAWGDEITAAEAAAQSDDDRAVAATARAQWQVGIAVLNALGANIAG